MAERDLLLGVDCGTSVAKAALFNGVGREVGLAQEAFATTSPHPGWAEYDPEALWRTACAAIRGVLADRPGMAQRIAAVGLTGAGNGVLLLDEDDRPVRPGVTALDARAADLIAEDADTDLPDRRRAVHGQSAWTGQTITVLHWLSRHEPDAIRRTARAFVIKDYIKRRLTGAFVSDGSELSKLGLTDIRRGDCTDELLALYGLGAMASAIAPVAPSTQIIGEVTPAAAAATGLIAGTAVVNGLADIDASALGGGVSRAGQLSVVAGTWSINQLIVDAPVFDARLFGLSRYVVPGLYEQLEASPSSTANLSWFVEHACADLRAEAARLRGSVYDRVNDLVASVAPASTEVFFHPYLYGSNTRPNARAGFYGMAGWHTKADLLAALFEGVVFSHHQHVEKLMAPGVPVTECRLSGGAANSAAWSQMFADVMGLPVVVPDTGESGALGAAMCAAVGAGLYGDLPDAAEAMVRVRQVYRPDPALTARYAARYAGYRRITDRMGPVWDELHETFAAADGKEQSDGPGA